jgi:phage terminase large subunit-like protein
MVEFPHSVPNLTEASSNLYELIKGRNLAVYSDPEIGLAISRYVAIETSRGWRIAKEKASHKIDVVVALAMAALGAIAQKIDPMDQMEAWYRSAASTSGRRGRQTRPKATAAHRSDVASVLA